MKNIPESKRSASEMLKEFLDNNESIDAEVTSDGVYLCEPDVIKLMERFACQPPSPSVNDQTYLRNLVDIVWNHVTDSTEVPSTSVADKLIKQAGIVASPSVNEEIMKKQHELIELFVHPYRGRNPFREMEYYKKIEVINSELSSLKSQSKESLNSEI
jgi:hypothetical protein